MTDASTIALDGPAGSGKSTTGARLAQQLGYSFVDAGMLYRAITGLALAEQRDLADEQALVAMLDRNTLAIRPVDGCAVSEILVNGETPDYDLRSPAINAAVATVAAHPGVRQVVRRIQAAIAQQGRVVFAGRDIGTVVLPHADLKIFMQVSLAERARRRYAVLSEHRSDITLDDVRADLAERDRHDSERAESPLRIPPDAIVIHADALSIEETVAQIMAHARRSPA